MKKLFCGLAIITSFTLVSCSSSNDSYFEEGYEVGKDTDSLTWQDTRDDFFKKYEGEITNISMQLTQMENDSYDLSPDKRNDAREKIKDTRDDLYKARNEFNDLREKSPEDWKEKRDEFLSTMNKVEGQFEDAQDYFN